MTCFCALAQCDTNKLHFTIYAHHCHSHVIAGTCSQNAALLKIECSDDTRSPPAEVDIQISRWSLWKSAPSQALFVVAEVHVYCQPLRPLGPVYAIKLYRMNWGRNSLARVREERCGYIRMHVL